jgi:hypothetical protein
MKYILIIILLASCSKEPCQTPQIEKIVGNVIHFPKGEYTLEIRGLDNPYSGTIKVSGTSYYFEGASYQARIKSQCSEYSEWVKNK